MTTVPNAVPNDSPLAWVRLVIHFMLSATARTIHCRSWAPWVRLMITIILVVVLVIGGQIVLTVGPGLLARPGLLPG